MKLRDYTEVELDKCRELCNFTEEELQYFELKAKDKSNVYIARHMNVSASQVSKFSKRVRDKIKRVL